MDNDEPKVRYAVVGAGNIAQRAVLPAFDHADSNSRLVAIVSGDPEKRSALRERYELELVGGYSEFESILELGAIDAVYIATSNSRHEEFALRAAERGVHVLCEKPLAPTAEGCCAMIDACETQGVKLMVAYRLQFEKSTLEAVEIARSGKLGYLQLFSSFFSDVVRPDDIRRDPGLAGGATYDLGVYCVNAARHLFDAEPELVVAQSVVREGTDDTTVAVLRFPGDRTAQFCVSNTTARVSSYRIAGTRGDLRVEPAYECLGEIVHTLTLGDDIVQTSFDRGDPFARELTYFSDCILSDRDPEPSGEEGWCDVRVIEAILESAGTGRPVALAPYQRHRAPAHHALPDRVDGPGASASMKTG